MSIEHQGAQPGIEPYGIEPVQSPPPAYGEKQDLPRANEHQLVNEQPNVEPNRISYVAGPKYSVPLGDLGETSEWVDCPYCMKRTQTEVKKEHSSMTIIVGVLMGVFCVCVACVPCIAGWFPDTSHYCSECKKHLTYRPHNGVVQVIKPDSQRGVPSRYTA